MKTLPFNFFKDLPSCNALEVFHVEISPSISSSGQLFKALYRQLEFPGYFGFNWDALYDCLRDLEWLPCHKVLLIHKALPKLPEKDLKIYLEILRDATLDLKRDNKRALEVYFRAADQDMVEKIIA